MVRLTKDIGRKREGGWEGSGEFYSICSNRGNWEGQEVLSSAVHDQGDKVCVHLSWGDRLWS